ncbi:MAG: hypothetical protein GY703_01305 [Gammaproteobacteria bacterium]|nr:hypothetical protein [Gammaproteobacteria bacterium]
MLKNTLFIVVPLVLLAGNAQAHIGDHSSAHALEHVWLALMLLPLLGLLVPLMNRLRHKAEDRNRIDGAG